MHYIRRGSGNALFLLHGFCGSSRTWESTLDHLANHFDVIAPDWPGFGGSSQEPVCRSIEEYVAQVLALAERLEIERFSVVGHSMSSFVAQQLMISHGDRIQAAVLYGAGLKMDGSARFESAQQTIDCLNQHGPEQMAKRAAATWFIDGDRHPAYSRCLDAAQGMTREAGIAAINAMKDLDFTASLSSIATPALVIIGEKERTFPPAMGIALASAMRNASLCVLPDCAHAAHLERPQLFNTVVLDYLLRAVAPAKQQPTATHSPARS